MFLLKGRCSQRSDVKGRVTAYTARQTCSPGTKLHSQSSIFPPKKQDGRAHKTKNGGFGKCQGFFLTGRIGSGRVGSACVRVTHPTPPVIFKTLLIRPRPTRPDPTRPDPTRPASMLEAPDPTRPGPAGRMLTREKPWNNTT